MGAAPELIMSSQNRKHTGNQNWKLFFKAQELWLFVATNEVRFSPWCIMVSNMETRSVQFFMLAAIC